MLQTYKAILKGNQIEWSDEAPDADGPIEVFVTLLPATHTQPDAGRGQRMADALAQIAAQATLPIDDASAWQREQRADRELPGREM